VFYYYPVIMDVEGIESALLPLPLLNATLLGLLPYPNPRAVLTQSVIAPLGVPWLSAPLSDVKQLTNSLITEVDRPPVSLVVVRLSLLDAVCFFTATAGAVMLPDATSAIAVTMATIANVVVLFAYIAIDIHTYLL
jgi:hypothetical protein